MPSMSAVATRGASRAMFGGLAGRSAPRTKSYARPSDMMPLTLHTSRTRSEQLQCIDLVPLLSE